MALGAIALGSFALGSFALGSFAFGAIAFGAIAFGSFALVVAMLGSCTNVDSGAAVSARALRIHEGLLTLDTHLDTAAQLAEPGWDIMDRHEYRQDLSQVDYPRMASGGLDGGFWAIYTPQGPRTPEGRARAREEALQSALRLRDMVAMNHAHFELALRADDAARIAALGKRVVFSSIENAYPLSDDLTLLRVFHSLGVRMVGPVHFVNNEFGDSSTDPNREWGGLSPRGEELVAEANELGIVLDASHASDEALDQMLASSATPVILSHSGCRAVYDHPRNVDDERLRRLAAAGGVIQMITSSEYLVYTPRRADRTAALQQLFERYGHPATLDPAERARFVRERRRIEQAYPVPRANIEDFMRHLLHALEVVGPEHVGIGADWDGGGGLDQLEDVSGLGVVTQRLLAKGYSVGDLEKIWSGNALRVLRAAEAHARCRRMTGREADCEADRKSPTGG